MFRDKKASKQAKAKEAMIKMNILLYSI